MSVTLGELARRSGFSPSTVSRALNGHPRISGPTTEKIQALARRLGYRPNLAARSLAGRRTRVIGYLAAGLENPLERLIVRGMEAAARASGYHLLVCLADGDGERLRGYGDILAQPLFEGVLVGLTARHWRDRAAVGKPAVYVDQWPRGPFPGVAVTSDHAATAAGFAAFFRSRGHRRVCYYGRGASDTVEEARLREARRAFAAAGLELERREPRVDLFADLRADLPAAEWPRAVVLEANWPLGDPGPRSPEVRAWLARADIGLYDRDPEGWAAADPGFAAAFTVRQDHHRMGRAAFEALVSLLRGGKPPKFTLVPVRESRLA